ncbi:MAG: methyl-accepting chemotaxis protein [Alphaproteobacteria bacterium]
MLSTLERQPQASVSESMKQSSLQTKKGLICQAIDILSSCKPTGDTLEDRELRDSLKKTSALLQARQCETLRAQAGYVREVSEAAIYIGWITHDVSEVANSSTAISESGAELATAAGHITEASQFCSVEIASVRDAMQKGTEDMRSTGEAMHAAATRVGTILEQVAKLENAVKQIAEMAKTIDAISRQTNLLALNATIESARAGEAGRGFAVVASEVKVLSGNTAKATEEIRTRIEMLSSGMEAIRQVTEASVKAVSKGEEEANAATAGFETLSKKIVNVDVHLSELSHHIATQQSATAEIAKSVTSISETATKVRTEIRSSLERSTKAEEYSLNEITKIGTSSIMQYIKGRELLTAAADFTVWKRCLASTLVGITSPSAELELSKHSKLKEWLNKVTDPKITRDVNYTRLKSSVDTAEMSAKQMVNYMRQQDWDKASEAYITAENMIEVIIAAATDLFDAQYASAA